MVFVNDLLGSPSFTLDEDHLIPTTENEVAAHVLQFGSRTIVSDMISALFAEVAYVTLIFDADFPVCFAAGYVAVKNELIALCIGEFSPFLW